MRTVVNEFLKQAKLHPDNIAVLDIQGAITYDRMNNLSAHLAEKTAAAGLPCCCHGPRRLSWPSSRCCAPAAPLCRLTRSIPRNGYA